MPIQDDLFPGVEGAGEDKAYTPLPADVYQVELTDIESRESKKYQSEELETKLVFKFTVIEPGDNYGRQHWEWCRMKVVGGEKPSNLYRAISGLLGKDLTQEECMNAPSLMTPAYLNGLMGKQVRLSMSIKASGKGNKVDAYLPIKEELPAYVAPEGKE